MERGLYVGRFQPFHLGHLKAVNDCLDRVQELTIAIGSAQLNHEPNNPFTISERMLMIRTALTDAEIDPKRWQLIPILDARAHHAWTSWVEILVPKYEIVFTNDPLTTRLFREKNVTVEEISLLDREIYSATEVRRRIARNEDWKKLVPQSIARIIEKIDGISRISDFRR
ncbi:MAG: nicotinamide-nucleotide adenylyltransferase [Thaumarchaeota archaeon]|nr:nicotinamide-nucleotide adenylyltransferase [Nitrososphaerota archaeon]MCZ6725274.1 nicotinamide-nucleotide adenylyltransferase [Nitrososphaerota archaeon]